MRYFELLCNLTCCAMANWIDNGFDMALINFNWAARSLKHFWVKNHQNEIWQTNFDTAILSRLHSHIRQITFCMLATCSCLFGNNTIKYVWNARFVLPYLNWNKNETKQLIDTIFSLIKVGNPNNKKTI